jgi:hypothetical protein
MQTVPTKTALCFHSLPQLLELSSDCLVTASSRLSLLAKFSPCLLDISIAKSRTALLNNMQLAWNLLFSTRKVVEMMCGKPRFILFQHSPENPEKRLAGNVSNNRQTKTILWSRMRVFLVSYKCTDVSENHMYTFTLKKL